MKKFLVITILWMTFGQCLMAAETCSRTATINYQEVLIDTDSTQKGEGLRYYLSKDPAALAYLDEYQKGNKIKWVNTVMGTLGSGMVLAGILSTNQPDTRQTFVVGGAVVILVNFLMAKTYEQYNETNLQRAIEEYNKRNLPRIHLGPAEENNRRPSEFPNLSFSWQRSF
ncbi:MAG: hypothetical protein WCG27_06870 [Pseudomonadota bacterium]